MALAETAFAGGFGMEIDLGKVPQSGLDRNDFILFSETPSRFVVTIDPTKKRNFDALLGDAVYGEIGVVSQSRIVRMMGLQKKTVIEADIDDLKEAWQKPLRF